MGHTVFTMYSAVQFMFLYPVALCLLLSFVPNVYSEKAYSSYLPPGGGGSVTPTVDVAHKIYKNDPGASTFVASELPENMERSKRVTASNLLTPSKPLNRDIKNSRKHSNRRIATIVTVAVAVVAVTLVAVIGLRAYKRKVQPDPHTPEEGEKKKTRMEQLADLEHDKEQRRNEERERELEKEKWVVKERELEASRDRRLDMVRAFEYLKGRSTMAETAKGLEWQSMEVHLGKHVDLIKTAIDRAKASNLQDQAQSLSNALAQVQAMIEDARKIAENTVNLSKRCNESLKFLEIPTEQQKMISDLDRAVAYKTGVEFVRTQVLQQAYKYMDKLADMAQSKTSGSEADNLLLDALLEANDVMKTSVQMAKKPVQSEQVVIRRFVAEFIDVANLTDSFSPMD